MSAMTSTAFAIRNAAKASLESQAFVTDVNALVGAMARPKFDTVEIGERVKLILAPYATSGISHHDRQGVVKQYVIGVGIYKRLTMASGEISESDFDAMLYLQEQIERWGWSAVDNRTCIMSKPANDVLYDGEQANGGRFFNVINLTFAADYDLQ